MQEIRIGTKSVFFIAPALMWLIAFAGFTQNRTDDPWFNELVAVFLGLFALSIVVIYLATRNWVVLDRDGLCYRPIGKVAWKDVDSIVVFGQERATRMGVQCDEAAVKYRFLGSSNARMTRRFFGYPILIEEFMLAAPSAEFHRHVRKFHSIWVEGQGLLGGLRAQDRGAD